MQVFKVGASYATVGALCFTPDGRGLVTGTPLGAMLWDVTGAPRVVRRFGSDLGYSVAVSPCGRFVAVRGDAVSVFDLTADEPKGPLFVAPRGLGVAFAPDGTEFAAPGLSPRQWAVPSWRVIRDEPPPRSPAVGSPFCTGSPAYAPDGRTIAVALAVLSEYEDRYDTRLVLFDRATGVVAAELPTPFGHAHPTQIAFRPDGAVLAGNYGPVLGVTSVADGEEVARVKAGTKHITALAFTPDGSKLVTVGNDTRVRVFDARTWAELTGYEWKIGKLRSVAVAPDGLRLAAGSDRGKVVIWDVDG